MIKNYNNLFLFKGILLWAIFYPSITHGTSSIDTLFNKNTFLIYFDRKDTIMHFIDNSSHFHYYKKSLSFYDEDKLIGIYPGFPNLIGNIGETFYFSFHFIDEIHGIDSHRKTFFRYDRKLSTFNTIMLSDYVDSSKFNYLESYSSCLYKEEIKIKKRNKKILAYFYFWIYSCGKDGKPTRKPQKIKKLYVEEKQGEGWFFTRLYMNFKSPFWCYPIN